MGQVEIHEFLWLGLKPHQLLRLELGLSERLLQVGSRLHFDQELRSTFKDRAESSLFAPTEEEKRLEV